MKLLVFVFLINSVAAQTTPEENTKATEKPGLCPGEYFRIHPDEIPWFEYNKSPPKHKPGGQPPLCQPFRNGQGRGPPCSPQPSAKMKNWSPGGFPHRDTSSEPSQEHHDGWTDQRKHRHPPLPLLSTAVGCTQDKDCEGGLKCCWTFCGLKCLNPLFEEETNEKDDKTVGSGGKNGMDWKPEGELERSVQMERGRTRGK